jgi:hypothetical protein
MDWAYNQFINFFSSFGITKTKNNKLRSSKKHEPPEDTYPQDNLLMDQVSMDKPFLKQKRYINNILDDNFAQNVVL